MPPGEPDGGGIWKLYPQQSSLHGTKGTRLPLPTLRVHRRLALGPAGGQRATICECRGWLHKLSVRPLVSPPQTPIPPTRQTRPDRRGAPPPYGAPRLGHRPRVDSTLRCRRFRSCHGSAECRLHVSPPPLVYRARRVYSIAVPPPPLLSNRVLWLGVSVHFLPKRGRFLL